MENGAKNRPAGDVEKLPTRREKKHGRIERKATHTAHREEKRKTRLFGI